MGPTEFINFTWKISSNQYRIIFDNKEIPTRSCKKTSYCNEKSSFALNTPLLSQETWGE